MRMLAEADDGYLEFLQKVRVAQHGEIRQMPPLRLQSGAPLRHRSPAQRQRKTVLDQGGKGAFAASEDSERKGETGVKAQKTI
jgi:hypothetical protein